MGKGCAVEPPAPGRSLNCSVLKEVGGRTEEEIQNSLTVVTIWAEEGQRKQSRSACGGENK